MKNNVEMVRASVPKSHNGPLPEEELSIVLKHLQARITADLRQGKVAYVINPFPVGNIPAIVVDDVVDNGTHLQVDVLLVDSEYKVKYLYWKHNNRKKQTNQSLPEDDDF
jgi:hypothetical protein